MHIATYSLHIITSCNITWICQSMHIVISWFHHSSESLFLWRWLWSCQLCNRSTFVLRQGQHGMEQLRQQLEQIQPKIQGGPWRGCIIQRRSCHHDVSKIWYIRTISCWQESGRVSNDQGPRDFQKKYCNLNSGTGDRNLSCKPLVSKRMNKEGALRVRNRLWLSSFSLGGSKRTALRVHKPSQNSEGC